MLHAPCRRDVIQMLMAGVAGLALPRDGRASAFARTDLWRASTRPHQSAGAAAAASHHATLGTTRLSETAFLVSGAGGNVVVVRGADGLVMINGGSAERSAE